GDLSSPASHAGPKRFLITDFVAFNEGHTEQMLSRLHRNSEFRRPCTATTAAPAATSGSQSHTLNGLAVHNDFELFRLSRGPRQFDFYQILSVDRELALHCDATARAEGQTIDSGILRLFLGQTISIDHHRHARIADRQPADFFSGVEVSLHRRR